MGYSGWPIYSAQWALSTGGFSIVTPPKLYGTAGAGRAVPFVLDGNRLSVEIFSAGPLCVCFRRFLRVLRVKTTRREVGYSGWPIYSAQWALSTGGFSIVTPPKLYGTAGAGRAVRFVLDGNRLLWGHPNRRIL